MSERLWLRPVRSQKKGDRIHKRGFVCGNHRTVHLMNKEFVIAPARRSDVFSGWWAAPQRRHLAVDINFEDAQGNSERVVRMICAACAVRMLLTAAGRHPRMEMGNDAMCNDHDTRSELHAALSIGIMLGNMIGSRQVPCLPRSGDRMGSLYCQKEPKPCP